MKYLRAISTSGPTRCRRSISSLVIGGTCDGGTAVSSSGSSGASGSFMGYDQLRVKSQRLRYHLEILAVIRVIATSYNRFSRSYPSCGRGRRGGAPVGCQPIPDLVLDPLFRGGGFTPARLREGLAYMDVPSVLLPAQI
jgi:hypothetical protein